MTQPLAYGMEGNRNYGLYYKHSNRVPLPGLLLGGLAGIVAGLLAATIYAYLIAYIPIIYANLLCVFAFGYALGFVPAKLMRWGKVRSLPVVLTVVAVVTAIAYCFHWIVWIHVLLNRGENSFEFTKLLTHPAGVLAVIGTVYENGTWGMGHGYSSSSNGASEQQMVNGVFLGIVWVAELVGIYWFAFLIAGKSQAEAPYCETCDAWCPTGVQIRSLAVTAKAQLKQNMEARNWADFDQIGASKSGIAHWHAIFHHGCPTCGQLNTLTAKSFITTRDKKGKLSTKEQILVNKLLATPQDVDAVRGFSKSGIDPVAVGDARAADALAQMSDPPREQEL